MSVKYHADVVLEALDGDRDEAVPGRGAETLDRGFDHRRHHVVRAGVQVGEEVLRRSYPGLVGEPILAEFAAEPSLRGDDRGCEGRGVAAGRVLEGICERDPDRLLELGRRE